MSQPSDSGDPYTTDRMLGDYELYDRSVDIVSAYEWLFTATRGGLPETVEHFERFPALEHRDGNRCTPDFTVLFKDRSAIVGEIANIPMDDRGVDRLCRQILRYDEASGIPGSSGLVVPSVTDVLLLVPLDVGTDAVQRILVERLARPDSAFSPQRSPVLVQFARLADKYVFQRRPDASNGSLYAGERVPNYAEYSDLKIRPEHFAEVKVRRAFVNDPVPPLYLATILWMKVWPSSRGAGRKEFEVRTSEVVRELRTQYNVGRARDVRAALGLLVAADLAIANGRDSWTVRRRALRGNDPDVHRIFAERVAERRDGRFGADRKVPRGRVARTAPGIGQGTLFDDWSEEGP